MQNFDDFIEPTRPGVECAVAPHEMSRDCRDQWDTLFEQCDAATDEPYWWTDDCEMVWKFSEAWDIWYEDDEWLLNLKRAHQKLRH